jgi:hypothetical protein
MRKAVRDKRQVQRLQAAAAVGTDHLSPEAAKVAQIGRIAVANLP